MAIFNSYVKLPEGNSWLVIVRNCSSWLLDIVTTQRHGKPINQQVRWYDGGDVFFFNWLSYEFQLYEYWLDKIDILDMISQDLEYPLAIKSGDWKSPN